MKQTTNDKIKSGLIELSELEPEGKITMSLLAGRCGISRSTLYSHYGSLDELVDELARDCAGRIFEMMRAGRAERPGFDGYRRAYAMVLRFCGEHRRMMRMVLNKPVFEEELVSAMQELLFQDYLDLSPEIRRSAAGNCASFIAGGAFRVLKDWLNRETSTPERAAADMMAGLVLAVQVLSS